MTKPFELNIVDERMLQLPGILKKAGLIKYQKEFLEIINVQRQNFTNQHFTVRQVLAVCESFAAYGEMKKDLLLWIFGLIDKPPFKGNMVKKKKSLIKYNFLL